MKICIVSAVYPPEFTYSATTSCDLARELAETGNQVKVLAPFPNKPQGKLFPGYRRRLYSRRQMPEGYRLDYCFSTLSRKSTMLSRWSENLSFGLTSSLNLLLGERPDVVYSNTWPVFAGTMVALVAALRNFPLIVSVQDVYPESLVSQGRAAGKGAMFRLLRWLDRRIALSAAGVVAISERFREIYVQDRAIEPDRVHVVQNWGERNGIEIDASQSDAFRRQHGIPEDAFMAVYAGNVGTASGAEGLVEAFAALQDIPSAYLLIAGSGSCLDACRKRAADLGCQRVVFHSPWLHHETAAVLGAADVLLLPTIGRQSLASVPSKLISYMLSGRPVVAQVLPQSETACLIERAEGGWLLDPDRPDSLATTLRRLMSLDPAELRQRGENGKAFAQAHMCRESNLPKLIAILAAAARRTGSIDGLSVQADN